MAALCFGSLPYLAHTLTRQARLGPTTCLVGDVSSIAHGPPGWYQVVDGLSERRVGCRVLTTTARLPHPCSAQQGSAG
jgi:hypothetical protein